MNTVLELKDIVCDLDEQSQLGFEGRDMNTVLELKAFVCDSAEQS